MTQTVRLVAESVIQETGGRVASRRELEEAARAQWAGAVPASAPKVQASVDPVPELHQSSPQYRRALAAAEATRPPPASKGLAGIGAALIILLFSIGYWAYHVGYSAKTRWDVVAEVLTISDAGYACQDERKQLTSHVATFAPVAYYNKDEQRRALAIEVIDAACSSLAALPRPQAAASPTAASAAERRGELELARVANMAGALRTALALKAAGPAPDTQRRADADAAARELWESYQAQLVWPWLASIAVAITLVGLGGWALQRDLMGALLTPRNRLSLSKSQLVFWTILVLSALLVTSLFLLGVSELLPSPLPVYDERVWALLGIDIAAVAVAAGIMNNKARQSKVELPATAQDQPFPNDSVGQVEHRISPHDWSFFDLFTLEDAVDPRRFDATRFQHLIISLVLFTVFFGMTFTIFSTIGPASDWGEWASKHALPKINDTFLVLLVISHAGYLIGKGTPAAPS